MNWVDCLMNVDTLQCTNGTNSVDQLKLKRGTRCWPCRNVQNTLNVLSTGRLESNTCCDIETTLIRLCIISSTSNFPYSIRSTSLSRPKQRKVIWILTTPLFKLSEWYAWAKQSGLFLKKPKFSHYVNVSALFLDRFRTWPRLLWNQMKNFDQTNCFVRVYIWILTGSHLVSLLDVDMLVEMSFLPLLFFRIATDFR